VPERAPLGMCSVGKADGSCATCWKRYAGDQVENAMLAEKAGAARCLVGRDAHPQKLLDAILEYLQDPALLAKAQRAALELSQVHTDDGRTVSSASYIAELLLQQINKSSASTGK